MAIGGLTENQIETMLVETPRRSFEHNEAC